MKRRIPWIAILPLIIFGLLSSTLIVVLYDRVSGNRVVTHLHKPAPVSHIPLLENPGLFFDSTGWAGRPYVINFFASWCLECRGEHEQLMALNAKHVPMIGVAVQDTQDALSLFLTSAGNPFALVANDAQGQSALAWGLTGVPETYIVDSSGFIRFHFVGALTEAVANDQVLPLWQSLQP